MPATDKKAARNRNLRLGLVTTALLVPLLPTHAAKKTAAEPFNGDLTTPSIKHGAECPLPAQRPCMIKKPVGKSYRVVTPGVSLEDLGEYWLANLSKIKDPKSNKAILQIWGSNNDLHEIEILFPKEPAAKEPAPKEAKPPAKEPVPPKEEETKPAE